MQLTKEELSIIREECNCYESTRAASIEALKIVQKNYGWVSDDAIVLIAQILHISVSDVEGVATFYNQIFRQPVGQNIIRYCDSIVCYVTGCNAIKKTLECILNIKIGNTTKDNKFTLLPTCCLGMCDKSPVIMINEDVYSHIVLSKINKILNLYR
ncbi:NADH-quinone oxidoreductase subunit E [Candidatus Blochmanniella vafra str. BVAF]|uniref:NADH-quinone oxidoreductase subunit E n=1 Tax=Blochmanniella vafra (strain BVAF) TaxID=859654 RepID=E8Q753_BLOVB|nr:NADH-quinone oxidoreductase subunit NuoE [Candidatus Blochmannia vafer]ADV33877.1 NADH-quinone oxidoreductase subunit E [Candidatus Blochmannia vafer str. BVAF]